NRNVSNIASKSIIEVFRYLDIDFKYNYSSKIHYNRNNDKNAKDKLIELCKIYKCDYYINSIGGKKLYKKEEFLSNRIFLNFIKPKEVVYQQFNNKNYEPNLSMIDILMNNSKNEVKKLLNEYILD
ncbi:WbqC family protein, partial [Proteus mirabilis]